MPSQEFTPDDHAPTQNRASPTNLIERIQRLESWQAPLLQHITNQQPEPRMHQAISNNSATIIELASDGGARDDLGSFGWNIAIEQTTIWKNKGPTFGLLPGSFRAESYGMLSAFLFLQTYFQHYNTNVSDQTILKFYCDSESLIKRIESKRNQSWTNPTSCLASDYDLESGIIQLITELPITTRFIHVKSHQDKDTEVHLLPWEAQMNVTADHLATDYLENYADPSKIVPFIKPAQANLTIQGATVTRRFANKLRMAASSPDLQNRMITRNNWSTQIFKSIHWDAPGKALMTLEHSTQIFLTKFVHEHLPTRKHMKKIGETDSDKCPSCLHTQETAWHMLKCENREEWRGKLQQTLRNTLHINKTQPDLQIILLQGVKEAIKDPNYQMNTTNREPRFQLLIQAQNLIGWNHLIKGRLSHHWIQCQQAHIYLDPDTDSTKQSGEIWLKRVLNCIWTALWNLWLLRNDDMHGRDRPEREKRRIEKLAPRVTALYEKADTLLAADRDIFAIPLTTRLTFPSGELQAWIKLVTPTVKRATRDAEESLRRTNHTLLPHLQSRPDPLTRNEHVNELRPVPRMTPGSKT
jgi:hypothetical protein